MLIALQVNMQMWMSARILGEAQVAVTRRELPLHSPPMRALHSPQKGEKSNAEQTKAWHGWQYSSSLAGRGGESDCEAAARRGRAQLAGT